MLARQKIQSYLKLHCCTAYTVYANRRAMIINCANIMMTSVFSVVLNGEHLNNVLYYVNGIFITAVFPEIDITPNSNLYLFTKKKNQLN